MRVMPAKMSCVVSFDQRVKGYIETNGFFETAYIVKGDRKIGEPIETSGVLVTSGLGRLESER